PAIEAVNVTSNPTAVNTTPGGTAIATLTVQNAGNVTENSVTFAVTGPAGLTVSGLLPLTLSPGQSVTENITLTPDAATPLNSTLTPTITETYGPADAPLTQTLQIPVNVVAPGAVAIADAAVAAAQLGDGSLGNRLTDLSTALTN